MNWDVKIYTAKIFNDDELRYGVEWNQADLSRVADAVNRIIELRTLYDQNIVVVNMSFGLNGASLRRFFA